MGTNYFLVRDTDTLVCRTCGSNPTALHIGKSSFGWTFTWRGYRKGDGVTSFEELSLTSSAEWFAFLDERTGQGWRIEDEYDRQKELAVFRQLVENKRADGRRHGIDCDRDTFGQRLDCTVDETGDSVAFYHFS